MVPFPDASLMAVEHAAFFPTARPLPSGAPPLPSCKCGSQPAYLHRRHGRGRPIHARHAWPGGGKRSAAGTPPRDPLPSPRALYQFLSISKPAFPALLACLSSQPSSNKFLLPPIGWSISVANRTLKTLKWNLAHLVFFQLQVRTLYWVMKSWS